MTGEPRAVEVARKITVEGPFSVAKKDELDAQSAGLIIQVWDNLNPENQALWRDKLGEFNVCETAAVMWDKFGHVFRIGGI